MRLIEKIKFVFKRQNFVLVCGQGKKTAKKAIECVLEKKFKIGKEILVCEEEKGNLRDFEYFLKKAPISVLLVTHCSDIPFDRDYFATEREETKEIVELAKKLLPKTNLILNFDDETVRGIKDETNLHTLTFGFQQRADFFANFVKLNFGTNFKVNFKGATVPFWLEGIFGKEQIYAALAACATGYVFGMNLVEVSRAIRDYKSLPGKMRLIEGINDSFVLDDAESATLFSMIEAILILGKIPGFKRKIAVLGDVIGIGKYTIEAHETIGEFVAKNANLLFTFGERAKFIAKGAFEKGMESSRIFSFSKPKDGISKLKETIKKGDLILVDGSKEINMSEIVDQIRKIW